MPTNTWFQSAEERQEHIDMIRSQKKWPWADSLPMKNPIRRDTISVHNDKPYLGLVLTEGEPVVHFDDGTKEVYSSVEEMVDAGWVVD